MPRILIADDNSNIQKMVTLAFEGAGIEVVSVSNGGAAIRTLPDTSPDLVLADVFMPVRNGYEVCEFIKHEPRFSHLPVILLVGAFDPLDESEAQRVSADGILKKPFIPPEPLINMVKALLVKAANERPEVPVAHGAQAAPEEAAKPAAAAPAVAVEEFSDAPPEEFGPSLLEPDFGIHEETLAFGSLLETPAEQQAPAEPASLQASGFSAPTSVQDHRWGDSSDSIGALAAEESESPKPPEFLGADIPELDDIVPPSDMLSEKLITHAPLENGIEPPLPEAGSDVHFEFPEFVPVFDAPVSDAAPEALGSPEEIPELSWDHAAGESAPEPTRLDPLSEARTETVTEAGTGEVTPTPLQATEAEPAAVALAGDALQDSAAPAVADAAPAMRFPVPVFPGSEKLWATPQSTSSETTPNADDPKEVTESQQHAAPLPGPVPEPIAESVPPVESAEAADSVLDGVLDRAGAVLEPAAFELVTAEMNADLSPSIALGAERVPTAAAPAAEITTPAQPIDPELIEAVVTRIVERMQPRVMDVVTREILRPLVEALVHREINKAEE